MQNKAQKGYVLAIVLVLTFVMSLTIVSSFSVVYRYMKLTERGIENLRDELYIPAISSEEESGSESESESETEIFTQEEWIESDEAIESEVGHDG